MVLFMFSFLNYLSGRWVQQLQADLDALVHLDKPNVNALKCKLPVSHLGIFIFLVLLFTFQSKTRKSSHSRGAHRSISTPLAAWSL